MVRFAFAACALLLFGCASQERAPATAPGSVAYVNGQVFTGERFVRRDLVVEDGRFVSSSPANAAERVDLAGAYLTPPFCEAHNHNLGAAYRNDETIARYLNEGILYVGIMSNLPALTDQVRSAYNAPRSVDVVFANGGLTASGGHPIPLREALLERGAYPGFTTETLADHAYFVIDDEADLERRWPLVLALRPDVIKVFLLVSEEYEQRRHDPAFVGRRGLNPALVAPIVARAQASGLRVFAHVETAHDFRVAVESGVSTIAHLPGSNRVTRIALEDAREAARRGVFVVTTAILIERRRHLETYAALRAAQIENLRTLRAAGVRLAIGSDVFEETSSAEGAYLAELGVFSNLDLLRMWSTDCAQALLADRQVGVLAPGFEASFLALGGDPLSNWAATRDIKLVVKEGVVLDRAER